MCKSAQGLFALSLETQYKETYCIIRTWSIASCNVTNLFATTNLPNKYHLFPVVFFSSDTYLMRILYPVLIKSKPTFLFIAVSLVPWTLSTITFWYVILFCFSVALWFCPHFSWYPTYSPCSLSASSPTLQNHLITFATGFAFPSQFLLWQCKKNLMLRPLWPWTSSVLLNGNELYPRSLMKRFKVHTFLITDTLKEWEIYMNLLFSICFSIFFRSWFSPLKICKLFSQCIEGL